MKIIIIIITLLLSFNAYAYTSVVILSKGKIISSHLTDDVNYKHVLLVIWNESIYECVGNTGTRNDKTIECHPLRDF